MEHSEEICSSPESFALRYVGRISYWFQTKGQALASPFLSLHSLLLNGPDPMKEHLQALSNELAKAKPDRSLFLHALTHWLAEGLDLWAACRWLNDHQARPLCSPPFPVDQPISSTPDP